VPAADPIPRAARGLALAACLTSAGCSHDVKIGAVISETGAAAAYGESVRKGIDLAQEEIDTAGGLRGGGSVTVVYRDDATSPSRGREVVEELIDRERVAIIIGAVSSTVSLAIAPLCEERKVILLSPSASAPQLSTAGEHVYRIYPSDVGEGTSMARFAKDLGLERLVVFAHDSDYGRGLSNVFREQYEGKYRQVVETVLFREGDASGFPAAVARVRSLKADGIYVVAYQQDVARLLEALRRAEVSTIVMASSAVTGAIVRLAGDAAENLVFPQMTFDLDSPEPAVAAFVRAYRGRYGQDPDIYAAHGYDALKILVHAIDLSPSARPEDLITVLNGVHDYAGAAGTTTFDRNGDVLRHPRILLIRGGRAVPYDQFVAEGGSLLARS
jgi:branched-chain amino acid transport system substrate-binding protein